MTKAGLTLGATAAAAVLLGGSIWYYEQYFGTEQHSADVTAAMTRQGDAELAAALQRVEPCSPNTRQIGDVAKALEKKQLVGADDDAEDRRVWASLQRTVQSVRRPYDRGEMPNLNVEVLDGVAERGGLDTTARGWQNDPRCEKEWSIDVDLKIPQAAVETEVVGHVRIPVTVAADGTVRGSGMMQLNAREAALPPFCVIHTVSAPTTIEIAGKLARDQFDLRLSNSPVTLPIRTTCDLPQPAGPQEYTVPIPFQPLQNFEMSVPAASGGMANIPPGIQLFVTTRT